MSPIGGQKKRFLVVWKILGSSSCWNTRNNQKRNPIALKRSSCCPTGGLKKTGRVQRRWLPEASAGGRSFMSFFLVQQEPTASCNKHTQKKTDSGQWEPPLTKKGSASSAQEERDRSLNRSPSLSFSSDQRNLFVWNFFLFHFFSLFFPEAAISENTAPDYVLNKMFVSICGHFSSNSAGPLHTLGQL